MITRYTLSLLSIITATSLFSIAFSIAYAADSIILKNGDSLSGKLTDSDTYGVLTLTHPHTEKPVKIKESSVERIAFDSTENKNITLTESIRLINGDHFPCNITELNDDIVSFKSESVGSHTITRDKVSQIRFNTKANKTLYTGPGNDLSDWKTSSEDWKLNNGILSATKRSDAAKKISNLTENYILEFETSWEQTSPNIRLCFSSNRAQADRNSEYYYIALNSHGIILYRSIRGKYTTLAQYLRSDNDLYSQSKIQVAIYVDRKHSKLALYLNGKLAKTISDTKTAPKGNYIIIQNMQRTGVLTEISDIKISSWGGKVSGDIMSKADSLTDNDLITDLTGNVMTGKILSLSRNDGVVSLNFKAPFAKKNSTILGKAIDLLEFKIAPDVEILSEPIYHLKLVSGGLISFSSSQMTDGKLNVMHPLLGKVLIPKANLSSVVTIPEKTKPVEAEE